MAYDTELAERLAARLAGEPDLTEKRMFGGLAFLLSGHLTVAASGHGGMLLRIDPAQQEALLQDPLAAPFVSQGREMAGWLRVDLDAAAPDEDLHRWVGLAVAYVRTLPPK